MNYYLLTIPKSEIPAFLDLKVGDTITFNEECGEETIYFKDNIKLKTFNKKGIESSYIAFGIVPGTVEKFPIIMI